MDSIRVGSFLRELRTKKGHTQKEIAELCNISSQAVSKWEKGDSIPDVEQLQRLSLLYQITIHEILNGEKDVHVDVSRKNQYKITLALSIVVFFAYAFNYVELSHPQGFGWIDEVYRGYQLILNGVGGGVFVLTMVIFTIFVSHLLLNLLMVLKAIEPSKRIDFYMICSTLFIIIMSLYTMAISMFFVFPQLWILMVMGLTLIIVVQHQNEFSELKQIKKHQKVNQLPAEMMLPDAVLSTSILKSVRVNYMVLTVAYVSAAALLFMTLVNNLLTADQPDLTPFLLVIALVTLVLAITLAYLYSLLGSIYSALILAISGFLALLLIPSGLTRVAPFSLLIILI